MTNKMEWLGTSLGALVGLAAISSAALARPDPGPGGGNCCFTKCCPDGQGGTNCAEDCLGYRCPSNQVCSGSGTCDGGTPHATAACVANP